MKRNAVVISAVVLCVGAWLAWAVRRDRRLDGFNSVSVGMAEADVRRVLGSPNRVEACNDLLTPLPKDEAEGCARQFHYASPYPLVPQYYVVRFDATSRVKSTDEYDSP